MTGSPSISISFVAANATEEKTDNNNAVLSYGERKRTGDYEYIEYTFSYKLNAAMFGYSSWHEYKGLARYSVTG